MELSKYIIIYCENNFYLSHSPFLDWDEMIDKARYIADFGDIPSVRRAIELLNKDPKLKNDKINIMMSSKMKKQLERKKKQKQKFVGGLQVKKGPFLIEFN